jgi:hypothetical protein
MIIESVRASHQPVDVLGGREVARRPSGVAWRPRDIDPALTDLDWSDSVGTAIMMISSAAIVASIAAIARLVWL